MGNIEMFKLKRGPEFYSYLTFRHERIEIQCRRLSMHSFHSNFHVIPSGGEFHNVLRQVSFTFVQLASKFVQMLDSTFDFFRSSAPQINALTHQDSIFGTPIFIVGTTFQMCQLFGSIFLHGEIFGQIVLNFGIIFPFRHGFIQIRTFRIESRRFVPFHNHLGPINGQICMCRFNATLGQCTIGIPETTRLQHETDDILDRPFQFRSDSWHGIVDSPCH